MSKLIYFLLGALLYHDLRNKIEGLRQDNDQLLQYVKAENEAAMDWMTDLEGNLEQTTIDAGHAIGELDTEMKLLQVDFYNFLKTYRHWSEAECKFISLEPYINEKMNIEEVETFLRRRGLKFTTNDNYVSPKLP